MAEERIPAALRQLVAEHALGCCEYCRSQQAFAMQPFSVEHVLPRSRGGTSAAENLAWSCQGCNNHKYTRTEAPDPVDGTLVPLYNPRTQRWREHFTWSAETSRVLGLTPTGRATVVALRLNRDGLVNLRGVLFNEGLHPPPEPL
jgi:HNH endonuclease